MLIMFFRELRKCRSISISRNKRLQIFSAGSVRAIPNVFLLVGSALFASMCNLGYILLLHCAVLRIAE